uniref:Ig-like domain-containing protein n=1 Tax=Stegastes partitus TaxID=144197 RepID=A0A3B4ZIN3_9TELE
MASFSLLFPGLIAETTISPEQDEVSETEGQSVALRCNYETTSDYANLYWYKHHSDLQAPRFILWKEGKGDTDEYIPDERKYGSQTSDTSTTLTIRELTLADTALYYCLNWDSSTENTQTFTVEFDPQNRHIVFIVKMLSMNLSLFVTLFLLTIRGR